MSKYKTLGDLPIEMRETGLKTLYPQTMVCDLIEKLDSVDYKLEHYDYSISMRDNIKRMITILSDNRIEFE